MAHPRCARRSWKLTVWPHADKFTCIAFVLLIAQKGGDSMSLLFLYGIICNTVYFQNDLPSLWG